VTLVSDGGGKAFAAKHPVVGVRKVANLLAVVFRKLRAVGEVELTTVNGGPGVVFTVAGKPVEVLTLAADGEQVSRLYVILNPDKLCRWPAPAGGGDGSNRPGPWERTSNGTATELHEADPGAA
jgi:RNA polymerase sigma-70 factor (ECF subfamily)